MKRNSQREIEVWADWAGLDGPAFMGMLYAAPSRSAEVFSFEYDREWLKSANARDMDPSLRLFAGVQYPRSAKGNFGTFLDSSPDRWGRVLMKRREAQASRLEGREPRQLHESDYLLGVYDSHRMGGLRFRLEPDGPFLDDNKDFASPPWTSLRDLEFASLQIERQDAEKSQKYSSWLRMLIAPGGSLGGARPKAGVIDPEGRLWIAKFPSANDPYDIGLWEYVMHELCNQAGITTARADRRKFNTKHHTFLAKRFDRTDDGRRIHFASAMTLLGHEDGDDASTGASYLEMADFLTTAGASISEDLEQLWRRIVFNICVSNVDDHLRNHGFLLTPDGWQLSPAYDINPVPTGDGLKLNISFDDNAQDLDLAREVASLFRLKPARADDIMDEVVAAAKQWRRVAKSNGIGAHDQDVMKPAFRVAEWHHKLSHD